MQKFSFNFHLNIVIFLLIIICTLLTPRLHVTLIHGAHCSRCLFKMRIIMITTQSAKLASSCTCDINMVIFCIMHQTLSFRRKACSKVGLAIFAPALSSVEPDKVGPTRLWTKLALPMSSTFD